MLLLSVTPIKRALRRQAEVVRQSVDIAPRLVRVHSALRQSIKRSTRAVAVSWSYSDIHTRRLRKWWLQRWVPGTELPIFVHSLLKGTKRHILLYIYVSTLCIYISTC